MLWPFQSAAAFTVGQLQDVETLFWRKKGREDVFFSPCSVEQLYCRCLLFLSFLERFPCAEGYFMTALRKYLVCLFHIESRFSEGTA